MELLKDEAIKTLVYRMCPKICRSGTY